MSGIRRNPAGHFADFDFGEENETETRPSGKPQLFAKPDAGRRRQKCTLPPSEAAETPGPTTRGAYARWGKQWKKERLSLYWSGGR